MDDIQVLPEAIELDNTLAPFYSAFFDLCTTRINGMGIGVISWLSVRQYAMYAELDEYGTFFLHKVVKSLDPIYVEYLVNESKRNKKR